MQTQHANVDFWLPDVPPALSAPGNGNDLETEKLGVVTGVPFAAQDTRGDDSGMWECNE